MGIRKTELKLLPHLETKPSSQPQEFQACQLMEKLQVKGGVSCEPRPGPHAPTRIHKTGLHQRPTGGRGHTGRPTKWPASVLCSTKVASFSSPKIPARKYHLLLTGKDPMSTELNLPSPEVMLRFFSTALLSHNKVEPHKPEPGTPGHQSPRLNSPKRISQVHVGTWQFPSGHGICCSENQSQVSGNSNVKGELTGCKLKGAHIKGSPGSLNRQLFWATNYSF